MKFISVYIIHRYKFITFLCVKTVKQLNLRSAFNFLASCFFSMLALNNGFSSVMPTSHKSSTQLHTYLCIKDTSKVCAWKASKGGEAAFLFLTLNLPFRIGHKQCGNMQHACKTVSEAMDHNMFIGTAVEYFFNESMLFSCHSRQSAIAPANAEYIHNALSPGSPKQAP
jgi:hypothetical protein